MTGHQWSWGLSLVAWSSLQLFIWLLNFFISPLPFLPPSVLQLRLNALHFLLHPLAILYVMTFLPTDSFVLLESVIAVLYLVKCCADIYPISSHSPWFASRMHVGFWYVGVGWDYNDCMNFLHNRQVDPVGGWLSDLILTWSATRPETGNSDDAATKQDSSIYWFLLDEPTLWNGLYFTPFILPSFPPIYLSLPFRCHCLCFLMTRYGGFMLAVKYRITWLCSKRKGKGMGWSSTKTQKRLPREY